MALVSRNTGSKKSGTVALNYRTGGSTRCGKSIICEVLAADLFKDQAHVFGKIAADDGVIQPGDGAIADGHYVSWC